LTLGDDIGDALFAVKCRTILALRLASSNAIVTMLDPMLAICETADNTALSIPYCRLVTSGLNISDAFIAF
jgi:hypothetical protein